MKTILTILFIILGALILGGYFIFLRPSLKNSDLSFQYGDSIHRLNYYLDNSKLSFSISDTTFIVQDSNANKAQFNFGSFSPSNSNQNTVNLFDTLSPEQFFQDWNRVGTNNNGVQGVVPPANCKYLMVSVNSNSQFNTVDKLSPTIYCRQTLDSANITPFNTL